MGNTLGGRKAKIMKIDGETFKVRTPVQAGEVVKNHPGLVLLDSAAVKQFGVRAKPLETYRNLKPNRVYFLVELPNAPKESKGPRRVSSGIRMSAKERLESLLLARRSVSDLTEVRQSHQLAEEYKQGLESSAMRVRMRLPKAEVERIVRESASEAEAARKIMELCKANSNAAAEVVGVLPARELQPKRVTFLPINQVAVVS